MKRKHIEPFLLVGVLCLLSTSWMVCAQAEENSQNVNENIKEENKAIRVGAEGNVENLGKHKAERIPYINVAVAFFAFIAACCSAYAAFKANSIAKNSILKELVSDYAKPEMGKSVKTLWHYYRNDFNENAREFADKFKTYTEKGIERGKEIDDARRQVSHFYQCMAMLHEGDAIPERLLYRLWSGKDLRMIPDILIPLEKALVESRNEKVDEEDFKLLLALYEDSKKSHERTLGN